MGKKKVIKVHFVSHSSDVLASHRMRVLTPVSLLNQAGFDATWSDTANMSADVNVFQKHMNTQYDYQMIDMLKVFNKKTIFDICDCHFSKPKIGDYYRTMSKLATVVTGNSYNLNKKIEEETGVTPEFVKDPITFPEYPFKEWDKAEKPNLLWYGHITNFEPMVELDKAIPSDYKLTAITNKDLGGTYNFIPWEVGVVEEAIQYYDIVLLPLGVNEDKQYKNTNRAVDALMAGKFVITDSEKVYGELKDFIYIGDILEGISWFENNYEKAKEKILNGQKYVKEHYSSVVIQQQWVNAISKTISKE